MALAPCWACDGCRKCRKAGTEFAAFSLANGTNCWQAGIEIAPLPGFTGRKALIGPGDVGEMLLFGPPEMHQLARGFDAGAISVPGKMRLSGMIFYEPFHRAFQHFAQLQFVAGTETLQHIPETKSHTTDEIYR